MAIYSRIASVAAILPLFLVGVGCSDAGDQASSREASRTNPYLGDGGVAELQLSRELLLDLRGDGVPEQVLLSVHGDDPRALEIDLTVLGPGGQTLYASSWSSGDYPEIQRGGGQMSDWVAAQAVRERLEDLVTDDAIEPLMEAEVDLSALVRELQLEEWRRARDLPASVPLAPDEAEEVAAIQIPEERGRELAETLLGRPGFTYLAGDSLRVIVWSPELERMVTVYACC